MKECSTRGCTEKARDRVYFTDPEEIVSYCTNCAVYNYKHNTDAFKVVEINHE